MRARTPLILFIILLVLVGITFYAIKFQEKKESQEKLFVKLNDKVEKIEIDRKDGTKVVFEKEGARWMMRKPKNVEADDYVVGRIADEVSELRYERLVEERTADLKKYGLLKPEVTLKIWEKGNQNPYVIKVGDKNPINSDRYAMLEGESRVVLLSSFFTDLLFKDVMDYRNKKIAKFDESKAKKIEVSGKVNYVLEKIGKEWYLTKPVKALANNYKCDDILYAITGAEAKEFVSDKADEKEKKKYGLDKPDLKVVVDLGKEKVRFELVKKDENYYLLKGNNIYKVEESLYNSLKKEIKELREKRLVRFYSFEVQSIEWKRGKEQFLAVKEKDKWVAKKPFKGELEKTKVEDFLRNVEDLEAEEFVDNPGKFRPQVVVTFKLEEGKTVTIELQEKDDKLYGKDRKLNYLLVFDKKISDIFPEKAEEWKKESE